MLCVELSLNYDYCVKFNPTASLCDVNTSLVVKTGSSETETKAKTSSAKTKTKTKTKIK